MPSRGIRNRAMRVFLVMGNLAEVHAKNFLRRRVIHRSCGEQLLRALLASMNNSGIAISRGLQSTEGEYCGQASRSDGLNATVVFNRSPVAPRRRIVCLAAVRGLKPTAT